MVRPCDLSTGIVADDGDGFDKSFVESNDVGLAIIPGVNSGENFSLYEPPSDW